MNKLNLKQLVPLVLGTLLALLGLALLPNGGAEPIILGIICLLIGLGYVAFILITPFMKNEKFGVFTSIFFLAGFPFYLLVSDLITIIDNSQGLALIGWIMVIASILAELGIIIFAILNVFKKDSLIGKIKSISVLVLLCMLIVGVIFSYRGVPLTITGTTLLEYAFIVCFAFIGLNATRESESSDNKEKKEEKAEEKEEKPEEKEENKEVTE